MNVFQFKSFFAGKNRYDRPKIPFRYHLWFWLFYFFMNFIRWGAYFDDYSYSLKSNILEFIIHIPFAYFNLYFLLPKFILNHKYKEYLFWLFASIFLAYVIRTFLTYYLITEDIWPETNKDYKPYNINYIVAVVIGELYVLAIVTSVYLTMVWINERNRNKALIESQLKIKLEFLKNQIQPHFFFNTLNNLYSLSLQSSSKVPEVIIKLSKLMEYVLYDINDVQSVPLLKEIEYISNYIEIEKLRFSDVVSIFNIESEIENVQIPPLLLISFIENAFKHGGVNNKNLIIKLNVQIIEEQLHFVIINNFNPDTKTKVKGGIGMNNLQKRLELLYKSDFILEEKVKFNYFIIRLQIPLQYED